MSQKDLYATLGVPRTASADEIKKAFRKIALESHPDRNPGNKAAEDRFKAANHAHDVLSDPQRRSLYDEFGEIGLRDGFDATRARAYARQAGGEFPFGAMFGGGAGPEDLSSIFEEFFAQGAQPRPSARGRRKKGRGAGPAFVTQGADVETEVSVDFVEAIRGAELTLSVQGRSVRVRIPAGARAGSRLRIPAQGMASPNGGPAGDLFLTLHVRPHPSFWLTADGGLHVRLPLTVSEAYHGARVPVPTPTGDVVLRIPAGVASNAVLRMRAKGVPEAHGAAGDLYVHVDIVPPDRRDAEIEEAMKRLELGYSRPVREGLRF